MGEIGIVIVTYNSGAEIGPCLDAAATSGAQVVVVDNASHDSTLAEVQRRGVKLIANSGNRGFAGAVNQGFRALDCPYILLLNPDAVIQTSLEPLRAACDLPRAAARGRETSGCHWKSTDRFHGQAFSRSGSSDFGSSLAQSGLAQ